MFETFGSTPDAVWIDRPLQDCYKTVRKEKDKLSGLFKYALWQYIRSIQIHSVNV